jgi:hypothetical protein
MKPLNAGDEQAVNEARKDEKLQAQQEIADLKEVMGLHAGRRMMYRLLGHAHLFETSFTATDAQVVAFREGERNVALWLLTECQNNAPELLIKMLTEGIRNDAPITNEGE